MSSEWYIQDPSMYISSQWLTKLSRSSLSRGDYVLEAGPRCWRVDREVLVESSNLLKAGLTHHCEENSNDHWIFRDVDPIVIDFFVEYLYTKGYTEPYLLSGRGWVKQKPPAMQRYVRPKPTNAGLTKDLEDDLIFPRKGMQYHLRKMVKDPHDKTEALRRSLRVFEFAHMYDITALANCASDKFRTILLQPPIGLDSPINNFVAIVKHIYEEITIDTKVIRQICVQYALARASLVVWFQSKRGMPQEFLSDISEAVTGYFGAKAVHQAAEDGRTVHEVVGDEEKEERTTWME